MSTTHKALRAWVYLILQFYFINWINKIFTTEIYLIQIKFLFYFIELSSKTICI